MDIDDQAPAVEPVRTPGPAAIAVFAILLALFFFRAFPLQLEPVRGTSAPDQFDATRAIERLSRVLDGTPHPVDSDKLAETRARLLREIMALGYTPELHDETACRGSISGSAIRCARVQNVLFSAGPASGPATVLTAHYDSVEASPGFGDDGLGVAVWLEVAHLLKQSPPQRPVLFLITDGEETALLGAQAFADQKMYGHEIGRIINLEARGNRGPAMMFETSHPNSNVVSDWASGAKRPVSNSLMTAIYELLPNSTDLTVYLPSGGQGVNMAVADGFDFYHTEHDDLAHLDPRSVQHMGDQALGATRAFLAAENRPAGEIVYADIVTRLFVSLPEMFGMLLLGLCFGVSAPLFMRPARDADWKRPDWLALAAPPAVIVAAGLFAFASSWLIGFIRPEPAFWTAYPQALNSVIFIGSMIAAALGLAFLAAAATRAALFAAGWLWFLAIGMGLTFAVPGMAMIFLIPAAVFVVAAIVAWLVPAAALVVRTVAALVVVLVFFPLIYLVDVMMTLQMAAVFGVLEGLALAPMLSLVGPLPRGGRLTFAALGAAFAVAFISTVMLPAYSADRPLHLNLLAHYDIDARKAELYASASPGALPPAVRDQLTVSDANLPGVTARLASRPLDFVDRPHATAAAVNHQPADGGGSVVTLQLSAPGAQLIRLRIPAGASPTQFSYAGKQIAMREAQAGYFTVDCNGRACDGAQLSFTLKPGAPTAEPPQWIIQGYWLGLPPDAAATAEARDDAALRYQMGDVTVTTRRLTF